MRTLTVKKLALVVLSGLIALGNAACAPGDNPGAPSDTGGSSGSGSTAGTAGEGGSGGSGGSGASGGTESQSAACVSGTNLPTAGFSPTSGPEATRFAQVVATSEVVLATVGTGLHRSLDGGDTWENVPAKAIVGQPISAMAARGKEIFVSAGQAIFRTSDAGLGWKDVSSPECAAPSYLSARGDDLYALCFGAPYHWNAETQAWDAIPDDSLAFDVIESDGSALYANSIYVPGVYRLDLKAPGATWQLVPDLPEWGYRAFAFIEGQGFAASSNELRRSSDGGLTWQELDIGDTADVADLLAVDGAVLAATSAGLKLSLDKGASWKTTPMGWFQTGFVLASDGEQVFSAADGLRRAAAPGAPWTSLHVRADMIWSLGAAKSAVLTGAQSGNFRSIDRGASWKPVAVPEDNGFVYSSTPFLHDGKVFANGHAILLVSEDDGASFQQLAFPPAGPYANINIMTSIDAGLVAGISVGAGSGCADVQDITTALYLSKDNGATWEKALNGFPITFTDCYGKDYTPGLTGIFQAGGALLATSNWKGAYRSTDQGASWSPVETPAGLGKLVRFATVGDAVVAAGSDGGVARSLDDGATWEASGLDGLHVGAFATAGDVLYAGIGGLFASPGDPGGIYYSTDSGASWKLADAAWQGRVTALAVHGGRLYAGTLEQSVWSAPLDCDTAK